MKILTPPSRHKRQHPLPPTRQKLQKDSRIQDQIPTPTKRTQRDKQSQDLPVRRAPGHDSKNTAHEQAEIERKLAPYDVRREAPEQRAREHTNVRGDGESICETGGEFEGGLPCDDGLDEEDERVYCVAEAVEDEEFPLVDGEADFVDGVVDEVHFGVEHGVG